MLERAERRRRGRRHPRPAAAPGADRRGAACCARSTDEGRRRLQPVERRPSLRRASDLRARRRRRDHGAARRARRRARGPHAVVVGRSPIVGKPVAHLLLGANATVTICHSRTPRPRRETRQADVARRRRRQRDLVTADMVKEGAAVVDVGITRTDAGLVGDVASRTSPRGPGSSRRCPAGSGR